MENLKVKVMGMSCPHCKMNVEINLKKISGIQTVIADIVNGEVVLKGENIDLNNVRTSVENLGYLYGGKLE